MTHTVRVSRLTRGLIVGVLLLSTTHIAAAQGAAPTPRPRTAWPATEWRGATGYPQTTEPGSEAEPQLLLEARLAITDHLTQYSYRWDSKDAVGFANLFTEDGVMERWREGAPVDGSRMVGRDAIFNYAKTSHEGRLADRQTRHHFSGIVFLDLSAESAVTENMALITHQTADDRVPFISASGIYRITWRTTEHGWRMAKRVLFTDRFVAPDDRD